MAIIGGINNSDIHSMAYPNCAPAIEYVATPLGSSSAAPVIKPGPIFFKYLSTLLLNPPIIIIINDTYILAQKKPLTI